MIDFTSALYLGMRHAHWALPPWLRLTTGRPAALEEPPEANRLSQDIARLLRCERAILAPSTLHLFWDLFDVLASPFTSTRGLARSLAGASSARTQRESLSPSFLNTIPIRLRRSCAAIAREAVTPSS
jgi:hypothetical protein